MTRQRIAAVAELTEGVTVKFQFERQGRRVEGFVARVRGRFVAYENVCQHLPLSLDHDDNRFFTTDGAHFICQTHGALYEPATGRCVRGPCVGARLRRLPVEVAEGGVWLRGTARRK
jgi:nitrite reductase/ring-hydroxylating ferredoxin subunit